MQSLGHDLIGSEAADSEVPPANQSMWKIRWMFLIAVSAGHEYVVGLAHVWQRRTRIEVTGIISYWNSCGVGDLG